VSKLPDTVSTIIDYGSTAVFIDNGYVSISLGLIWRSPG
jgi:hypothetical protein